jgi:hypothetical protein
MIPCAMTQLLSFVKRALINASYATSVGYMATALITASAFKKILTSQKILLLRNGRNFPTPLSMNGV